MNITPIVKIWVLRGFILLAGLYMTALGAAIIGAVALAGFIYTFYRNPFEESK